MKKRIGTRKTVMESRIEAYEQIRLAEIAYWQRMHPKATVTYNKKANTIDITYPLPVDMELLKNWADSIVIDRGLRREEIK